MKLETITLFTESMNSEFYNKIYTDNSAEIELLKQEFKFKKISFEEFLINLGELLKQKKS